MSETREMYKTFCAVWEFLREYCDCRTEEQFDQMYEAQKKLYKEHRSKLCGDLIQACLNEINRREQEAGEKI